MAAIEERENDVKSWVEQHTDALLAYANSKLSDHAQAEDLVQETFLAAFKSHERFKKQSSVKTWLTSILKNKIMDHYRKSYRRNETLFNEEVGSGMFDSNGNWLDSEMPSQWGNDQPLLDDINFQGTFDECIESLPNHWRDAVKLKYLKTELSFDDLGITKTNYWKILERARRQLRKCLELNWFKTA
ncbi:MAG: RNA polymerase sigma-70 factor (TIGR02943 family) [Bacteroidia bacterium]|jgi:RNA polymerase sigma-70 factor (TIGR02943 family)